MNVRLIYPILSLFFLLTCCRESPLAPQIIQFISKNDSSFSSLKSISVIEEMDEDETRLYYEKRIEEEKQRLTEQYKAFSLEPCIWYYKPEYFRGTPGLCTLKDIEWMEQYNDTIDFHRFGYRRINNSEASQKVNQQWWENHYKDTTRFRKESQIRQCLSQLQKKKAMLDDIQTRLSGDRSIEYYDELIARRTSYQNVTVNYLDKRGRTKFKKIIARLNDGDTLFFFTHRDMKSFLEPFKHLPTVNSENSNSEEIAFANSVSPSRGSFNIFNERMLGVSFDSTEAPREDRYKWSKSGCLGIVDTLQGFSRYPVFIYNLTGDPLLLYGLEYIQQAQDENGNWRPIEMSEGLYYEGPPHYILYPNHIGVGYVNRYEGSFKTKLRVKFRVGTLGWNGEHWQQAYYFYSEPYKGYINPEQFRLPNVRFMGNEILYDY